MARLPGYNDLDLLARSSAVKTLLLVAIAYKLGVERDPWLNQAEKDAHETLARLEAQAEQRMRVKNLAAEMYRDD